MASNQELQTEKRAEPSLLDTRVTSSHFISSKPTSILDFLDDEEFFLKIPFARLLLEKGLPRKTLSSMLRCGEFTGQAFKTSCACGSVVRPIRHKCSSRSCPFCAKRRQVRLVRHYVSLLKNLVSTPLYSLKLLTISPRNYGSYSEGSLHIRTSLSKMFRKKYFKDRVLGGIYVLEAKTKNRDGERRGWNCHVHLLVYSRFLNNRIYGFCNSCNRKMWIKKNKFSDTFYCSNRQCNSLVDWNKEDSALTFEVTKSFGREVTTDVQNVGSSVGALSYCLKYISSNKDDFYNENDFADYIVQTRSQRLVSTFGIFYSARFSPSPYCCSVCDVKFHSEIFLDYELPSANVPPPSTFKILFTSS